MPAAPATRSINPLGALTFGMVSAINTLGFGFAIMALMFNGPTASGYGIGIGVWVLSNVILALFTAWRDQLPGAVGIVQEAGIPLIAGAMTAAAASMTAAPEARVATVLAILGTSTLLTGALLIVVGQLRLGGLVRFVPYPVIAAFLAGAGFLLLRAGLSRMLGTDAPLEMLRALSEPRILARAIPGVGFALALSLGTRRLAHPLVVPGTILLAAAAFYAATAAAGLGDAEIRALGWLPAAAPAGRAVAFPTPAMLPLIDWGVVGAALPLMASAAVLTLIGLLLNTSGLELALGVELDPNRALRSTGMANLLTGAIGGMSGHVAVSGTLLADRMGVSGRTAGVARAAALLAFLAVAGTLVSAMPVFVTGGLVAYLGGELFTAWAIVSRRKLPVGEWAIIPLILLVIVLVGFLAGIGVGLLVAVLMFAYTYSRLPVVRFSASGRDLRSTVDRSAAATAHLGERGAAIEVMHLQGFLFFGTAERVVDQVRARLGATDQPALRYLVLDFRHVSGVDSAATACFMKLRKLSDARGVDVAYTEGPSALAEQFRRAGLVFDDAGPLSLQPDVNAALERCEAALLADLPTDDAARPLRDQLVARLGESPWIDPLMSAMTRVVVPAGAFVIRTGDTARDVFLVERGTLAVQVIGPDGAPLRLRTMTAGAIVGEVALYTRQPRGADVLAVEETVVHRLSAEALAELERETQEAAVLLHRLVATHLSGKLTVANRLIQRARL